MGFSNDPVARWIYPDPADFLSYFPGFIRTYAAGAFDSGTAFVTNDLAGASLWLKPCGTPDLEIILARFDVTIDVNIKPEVLEIFQRMASFRPQEPHWYMPMMGVDTFRQRKGTGNQLMRHALERCDEEHLPAYLECSNAKYISLYEKFDFSIRGTLKVGSSPVIYPMYRRAK
jgi:ribosomal protein S18 acetylase RimI-like enzyme